MTSTNLRSIEESTIDENLDRLTNCIIASPVALGTISLFLTGTSLGYFYQAIAEENISFALSGVVFLGMAAILHLEKHVQSQTVRG